MWMLLQFSCGPAAVCLLPSFSTLLPDWFTLGHQLQPLLLNLLMSSYFSCHHLHDNSETFKVASRSFYFHGRMYFESHRNNIDRLHSSWRQQTCFSVIWHNRDPFRFLRLAPVYCTTNWAAELCRRSSKRQMTGFGIVHLSHSIGYSKSKSVGLIWSLKWDLEGRQTESIQSNVAVVKRSFLVCLRP